MKIELEKITIREVANGYINDEEEGVVGYGGKLNIRPKYQREFVYKEKQRDAVIETVKKDFPLNVMYWVKNADNTYEVMDGQQRTISICEYVEGNFSLNDLYFDNLTDMEKEQILDYKMMIYFCEGNDKEKCLYELDNLLRRYMRFYLSDKNIKKFGERYKPYIIIGCIAIESNVRLTYTAPLEKGTHIYHAVYPVLKSRNP